MAELEALALFILVPAAAFAAGAVVMFSSYRGSRPPPPSPGAPPGPGARGRFVPLVGVLVVPVVFGGILWVLSLPFLADIEAGLPAGTTDLARLHLWSGIMFAVAACVTIGTEAWVGWRRMREALGVEFGRVLPLYVIPQTLSVFALVLAFLVLGAISDAIVLQVPFLSAGVDATVSGLLAFALGTLATPLGVAVSNRVEALDERGFLRALIPAEAGVAVAIAGLAYAFLQLGSLFG
jgi:hypothetical protein